MWLFSYVDIYFLKMYDKVTSVVNDDNLFGYQIINIHIIF